MTKFEHKRDFITFGRRPDQNCTDNYFGGSARRIYERITDHDRRDQKCHLFGMQQDVSKKGC